MTSDLDSVLHAKVAEIVQLYNAGDYHRGLARALAARDWAQAQHVVESPFYADLLDALGLLYKHNNELVSAEETLRAALEWRRQHWGVEHPDYISSLNNLATVYVDMARYAQAEQLYLQAQAILLSNVGDANEWYAGLLINLGQLYKILGDAVRAEKCYDHAIRFFAQPETLDATRLFLALNNLAELYKQLGLYSDARDILEHALTQARALVGDDDPRVIRLVENLASAEEALGNYAEAEKHYRAALARLDARGDSQTGAYAEALNNLAGVYTAMGDYAQAERHYQQALTIWRSAFGESHPNLAVGLHNLADVAINRGAPQDALPLLQHALEIETSVFGSAHPRLGASWNALAVAYRQLGNEQQAENSYHQTLKLWRNAYSEMHPQIALAQRNLARLYHSSGDYARAEPLYEQALAVQTRVYGETHSEIAETLYGLAGLYTATERPRAAFDLMRRAAAIDDRVLEQFLVIGSERQRLAHLETLRGRMNAFLTLVASYFPNDPEPVAAAFDLILRRKGLSIEAFAAPREPLWSQKHPELAALLHEWRTLRQQIAAETIQLLESNSLSEETQTLAAWQARREELEAQLARQIAELPHVKPLPDVSCQAICACLPEDACLVEWVHYEPARFGAVRDEPAWEAARYLAFVVCGGNSNRIHLVDAGDAQSIDALIQNYQRPTREDGMALRAALFDPLEPFLGGRARLWLAPDGELLALPFAALPVNQALYLIDRYRIMYLNTARDLVRLQIAPRVSDNPAVIVADPDFDLADESHSSAPARAGNASPQGRVVVFERLEGTRTEGQQIAELLGGTPPLMRDAAVKSVVKTLTAPRILHFATHGFFLPPPSDRESNKPHPRAQGAFQRLKRTSNPLLRSGLALAGANTFMRGGRLPVQAEDGLLTAEDVSGMDLEGTLLVVLSACETGRGAIRRGEGVMGLRRAFVLAGARVLVSSLWTVPDQETLQLMQHFYRRWLSGESATDALRSAQLELKAEAPHVAYWGAFICQNDVVVPDQPRLPVAG